MSLIKRLGIIGLFSAVAAFGSDIMGVYGKVEKVVLEPSTGAAQRAQVWGVFSLAKPSENGDEYTTPAKGYLYFTLPAGGTDAAAKEWADLQRIAGTGKVVAFSMRWNLKATVRKADARPANPDPYVMNIGVVLVQGRDDYPPVQAILKHKD